MTQSDARTAVCEQVTDKAGIRCGEPRVRQFVASASGVPETYCSHIGVGVIQKCMEP
ncbi:Uncharacterised protein [Bordetella pertussis]|nr:Uncharacterised protein [Bordetella pertussis]